MEKQCRREKARKGLELKNEFRRIRREEQLEKKKVKRKERKIMKEVEGILDIVEQTRKN